MTRVIIEVEDFNEKYYRYDLPDNGNALILKEICRPIQEEAISEIQLTEDQFMEICREVWRNPDKGEDQMMVIAKTNDWIVKDEIQQAIEDVVKHYNQGSIHWYLKDEDDQYDYFVEHNDKCMKAIELLQNKVKELKNETDTKG